MSLLCLKSRFFVKIKRCLRLVTCVNRKHWIWTNIYQNSTGLMVWDDTSGRKIVHLSHKWQNIDASNDQVPFECFTFTHIFPVQLFLIISSAYLTICLSVNYQISGMLQCFQAYTFYIHVLRLQCLLIGAFNCIQTGKGFLLGFLETNRDIDIDRVLFKPKILVLYENFSWAKLSSQAGSWRLSLAKQAS